MPKPTEVQKVTSGLGGGDGPKIENYSNMEDGLVLPITLLIVDGLPCGWAIREIKMC